MSGTDHPIAGYAFLAVALGGILMAGRAGITASAQRAFEHGLTKARELGAAGKLPEFDAQLEVARALAPDAALAGEKIGALRQEVQRLQVRHAVQVAEGGEVEQAEQLLAELVKREPGDLDALFNLGVAQLAREHLDDADATFRRVLEKNPRDFDAVAERAGIMMRRQQVEEAFALLETIPAEEGQMRRRLAQDPLWAELPDGERLQALIKKHKADEPLDTSMVKKPVVLE